MRASLVVVLLSFALPAAVAAGLRIIPQDRGGPEPAVRIEDNAGRPVANASVSFELPRTGPSGSFAHSKLRRGGGRRLTVQTDANGGALASGFRPNKKPGEFTIVVTATYEGQTQNASLRQTNAPTVLTSGQKSRGLAIGVFVLAIGAISLVTTLLAL